MLRRSLTTLLLPLLAIACQKQAADGGNASTGEAAARAARVPCALAGSATFKSICTVERTLSGDGLMLVMHHPDGGFRRLLVTTDGRGVVTADGSEPATIAVINPGTIEVSVGDDRYRLPATVKGQPLPAR